MAGTNCPYCSAYKRSAFKLANRVRELERDPEARAYANVVEERDRLKDELSRVRIEKESDGVLPALAVAAESLGYGRGQIPTKAQWDRALALADVLADELKEREGRMDDETYEVLSRLIMGA